MDGREVVDQPSTPAAVAGTVGNLLSHLVPGHEPRTVRSFEEDARHHGPLNRRPLGLRTVPLDRIVGSVGRARELGPDFLPLSGRWERSGRYERIYEALERGEVLPPVDLYKLGYNYYVLDGNHRVAAMKQLAGNDGDIDAYVTEFLPVGDTEASRVFLERRAFEQATGLTRIGAVERGHYPMLQAEIEACQAELNAATCREVPLKEAASDWYITVWLPRAEQIRRANLRRCWPEKRTADIYCYIRQHQTAESARLGRPVSWDEALQSFRALHCGRQRRLLDLHRLPNLRRLLNLHVPFRPGRAAGRPLPRPPDERGTED
jgi:hypothetical protein